MKKISVLLAAFGMALLMSAPAWAILDLSVSGEYVTGGTTKFEIGGVSSSKDLKGGTLLQAQGSILGFTVGADYYTDTVKDVDADLTEMALKVGYGIGLPGVDITALLTYEDWKTSETPSPLSGELQLKDLLLGVDAVFTGLPVFDVEGWYSASVTSDAAGDATSGLSGVDGSGFSYGLRLTHKLAAGFGLSGGYRTEEHKISYSGSSLKISNSGYMLGVNWTF